MDNNIQLFENKRVRTAWDEEREEWLFSVVDVVAVLTEQQTQRGASNYWAKLKERLIAEGFQPLTNCQQLKPISKKAILVSGLTSGCKPFKFEKN